MTKGRKGRKQRQSDVSKPHRPNATDTGPAAFGSDSILSLIKEQLSSCNPAPVGGVSVADSSLKSSPPHNLQNTTSSLSGMTISTSLNSTPDSSQSSDTLVTYPSDAQDINKLKLPQNEECKIINLRTGLCSGEENCKRVHVLPGKGRSNKSKIREIKSTEAPNSAISERRGEKLQGPGEVRRSFTNLKLHNSNSLKRSKIEQSGSVSGSADKPTPDPKEALKVYPPDYCRDWQLGRCFRYNCRFLHRPLPPDVCRDSPPGEALSTTRNSEILDRSTGGNKPLLQGWTHGHCWAFLKGSCRSGNRCRFKHIEPSRYSISNTAVSPAPSHVDHAGSNAGGVHQSSRNPQTRTTIPNKNGCLFCPLGLCRGTHRTAASFLLAEPRPMQTNKGGTTTQNISGAHRASKVCVRKTSDPPQLTIGAHPSPAKQSSDSEEITLEMLKGTRVTIGRGLQVLNVSTGFESNTVALGNLPAVISESEVRNIVDPFGEITSVKVYPEGPSSSARVVYADHSHAATAVASLNGCELYFAKITAELCNQAQGEGTGRLRACLVRIDIPAPGIFVYAGYQTLEQAEKIVKIMHGSTYKNHIISAQVYNGTPRVGPATVKFEGLPHQTSEKHVRSFGEGKGRPVAGDILLTKPVYKSLVNAINSIQDMLEEYGDVIDLDLSRAVPSNGRLRGVARFSDASGAAAACRALNGGRFAFLGRERIYLDHLHKISYKLPFPIFSALRTSLERLASFAQGQPGVQLHLNNIVSAEVDIELNASHLDSLKRVKAPLESLLNGETLTEVGQEKPVWDNFFSTPSGFAFAVSVGKKTRTYIRPNDMRGIIKIWGSDAGKTEAKRLLLDEVTRLRCTRSFALPLTGNILMKLLLNNLVDICKEIGDDNTSIDFETHQLVIRGSAEQFLWVVNYLSRQSESGLRNGSSNRDATGRATNGTCPVCLDGIEDAVGLHCGHATCKECLIRYMVSAGDNKIFPLKCLGNDNKCPELLPLSICQRLLQKEQFAALAEASFFAHIQTRPQEFHYCPTPDCPQIYRDDPGTTLQCPTCLVSICTSCHKVQHDDVECAVSYEMGERLFDEWREQHNVKICPSCSANIEKVAGCNHLMCVNCSTHICWECLKTFAASSEVYDHMGKAHGGIGL